jgi:regulatory protein
MSENTLYNTALAKAMARCSRRELCSEDLRRNLSTWGVDDNDAERIINSLISDNFINESRYATAYVRDKFRYNKWGKIKIAANLRAKKISGDIIRSALESIDASEYINFIRDNINSHRKFVKAKNQYDLKAKLLRYGVSKGFETNILYDILNDTEQV